MQRNAFYFVNARTYASAGEYRLPITSTVPPARSPERKRVHTQRAVSTLNRRIKSATWRRIIRDVSRSRQWQAQAFTLRRQWLGNNSAKLQDETTSIMPDIIDNV